MNCLALLDGKEFLETKDRKLWIDLKMCPGKFMCWRLVPQHLAILGGGRNFKGGVLLEEAETLALERWFGILIVLLSLCFLTA